MFCRALCKAQEGGMCYKTFQNIKNPELTGALYTGAKVCRYMLVSLCAKCESICIQSTKELGF